MKLLPLILLLAGAQSCVLGGGRADEGRVLERSKQETPAWTELAPGALQVAEGAYQYVEVRSGLLDLPLGIKQTQLSALQGGRAAVLNGLRRRLVEFAGARGIKLEDSTSPSAPEWEMHLEQALDDTSSKMLRTSDIFFERLESAKADGKGTYRVFVLVNVPADALGAMHASLTQRLKKAQAAELRRLAQALGAASPLEPAI